MLASRPDLRRARALLVAATVELLGCRPQVTAAAASAPSETWEPQTIEELSVSLELPRTWTLATTITAAMASPRPPEPDDTAIVLTNVVGDQPPLEAMTALLQLVAVTPERSSPWRSTGTHEEGTCRVGDDVALEFDLYAMPRDKDTMVVLVLHQPSLPPHRQQLVHRVIDSIQLGPSTTATRP